MTVVYIVELQCLSCARPMGEVQLVTEQTPIPYVLLRQRCRVCGGQPIRNDWSERVVYEDIDLEDMKPPRGRRPKVMERVPVGSIW